LVKKGPAGTIAEHQVRQGRIVAATLRLRPGGLLDRSGGPFFTNQRSSM